MKFSSSILKRCIYGQLISILFGIYQKFGSHIKASWSFLSVGLFFLILFFVNEIIIFLSKEKRTTDIPYKEIIICAFSVSLTNTCFMEAYSRTGTYFIVFLTQLNYPLSVIYKVYFKSQKENITLLRLLCYITVIIVSFIINKSTDPSPFKFSISGTTFTIIANIFLLINLFVLPVAVGKCGLLIYNRYVSIFCFIFTFIISTTFTLILGNLNLENIPSFYKEKYVPIIGYIVFLVVIYCTAPQYITKYTSISFNTSTLANSAYIGLISLYIEKFSILGLICHLVCILSVIVLTATVNIKKS